MSFRDLGDAPKSGGHASKQQPKQRRDEENSFEKSIKANIQEMQDAVRKASEKLEHAQKSFFSRRMGESLDNFLDQSQALSQRTQQLFRDWTIHMAGEPGERHRKKFSYEKLQKAFEEEVVHLKDVAQRAKLAQQEAVGNTQDNHYSRCDDLGCEEADDVEHGLLNDFDNATETCRTTAYQEDMTIRNRIVQERDEGIRRIQNQVTEVNQIIKELGSIVQDQGEHLQSIESEAEGSSTNTKQAVQELRKAVDRQRGSREKLCCMLAAAVLVLCFVILPQMHMLEFHHTASPNPGAESGNTLPETLVNAGSSTVTEHALTSWRAPSSSSSSISSSAGSSESVSPANLGEPRLVSKTGHSLT